MGLGQIAQTILNRNPDEGPAPPIRLVRTETNQQKHLLFFLAFIEVETSSKFCLKQESFCDFHTF